MGITKDIITELERIVGSNNIITDDVELTVYEADGSFVYTAKPDVVVFPRSTEEVAKVVRVAWENRIPIIGRGSGTSLSGGALPIEGGIVISLTRMNRVLELDVENETATVEAGVINLWVSDALAKLNYQYPIDLGYYFPADPGSQRVSTIGGNISHNAGGVKCFKYGVTVNNVRGLKVVLPNGEVRFFGGKVVENPGYDVIGIMSGSEGTMAIVTEAVLRIVSNYESVKTILAAFNSVEDAGTAVSRIISSGIRPVALEFMDKIAVNAIEAGPWGGGLPTDAEAILLIDVEGSEPGTNAEASRIIEILKSSGAYMVKLAKDRAEANRWWNARKQAFGAMGFVGPNYITGDGTIPRKKLPEALHRIREIGNKYGFRIANVFHAGDGNLHPLILYDERRPGERERALQAEDEILRMCVEIGGTITGEHGVGYYKKHLIGLLYTDYELNVMKNIKSVFDPLGIMNPGKIFPR
ncbi:FAD-binding oxidoreductase [Vulcanisaeta distributa]|uniref:FAD linked oxidase domain protein n=1 Tax=Vulcanisaeta distributa (strain DSM 14429 / JCM 11212 / NBRC 100878 / IC-017) TaxID=572478 RepID=E1QUS1_VULDI|nr:FAD-linked oxidase C-terminal domain-containing protein [Vulcanisaeta distributa]ADN49924.1 FAD linked oxidase domain protein [Vulcanisaeta distributa DSM 14429]